MGMAALCFRGYVAITNDISHGASKLHSEEEAYESGDDVEVSPRG